MLAGDEDIEATEGVTVWAVVVLSIDTAADMGVVDFRNGGPGVEREVVEETLLGVNVVDAVAVIFVVGVIKEDKPVADA